MRLEPSFRAGLYGTFALLFVTGAGWFVADKLKDAADGEFWQQLAAALLMIHGGTAMIALLFLGALAPIHIRRWWRAGRNRVTGAAMVAGNAVLMVTAFGLYYAGSDVLRPWIGNIHLALGLVLPALFLVHVWIAARGRAR
jgi:hypothetical protein